MAAKMEWNEFLDLYEHVSGSSRPPTTISTPQSLSDITESMKYTFSPQDIRDAIASLPAKSRKGTPTYPPQSHLSGLEDKRGTVPSGYFSGVAAGTNLTPPQTPSLPNDPKGATSGPPSPNNDFRTISWVPFQFVPSDSRSGSYVPPYSPPRHFSSTYKQVPEQPPNAQGKYTYLPLPAQRYVLSEMQTLLEHACFSFAERCMPHILEQNGWDCPEAGELNVWTHHLTAKGNYRDLHMFAQYNRITHPLEGLMESAKQIRHTAVHRTRLTVTYLAILMDHAVALCTILGEPEDLKQLQDIRDVTNSKISQLGDDAQQVGAE
ncbi:hypothetical protein ACLX1H_010110 [Fusarium chlamydosporum]